MKDFVHLSLASVVTLFSGVVTAVGVSNLQFVDLNSSRNLFVFGFSLFFGLSFPQWMTANPSSIDTGLISKVVVLYVDDMHAQSKCSPWQAVTK